MRSTENKPELRKVYEMEKRENKREKIEVKLEELIEYFDSCKLKPFSNNIILVNKDELDSYLHELRKCLPEEIKRYQKIIANREAIIAEAEGIRDKAKAEAQKIVDTATAKMNSYVTEDNITQTAYFKAQEIVEEAAEYASNTVATANQQAQDILDNAVTESNNMKDGATQYVDNLLAHIENLCSTYFDSTLGHLNGLLGDLNKCKETVQANRAELYPPVAPVAPIAPVIDTTTDFIPVQPEAPQKENEDLPDMELL